MAVVVAPICESFGAMVTFKRLFPCVNPLMSLPNVLMRETFAAEPATMKSFTGVNVPMLSHVIHGCVMFTTGHTDQSGLTIDQSSLAKPLDQFMIIGWRLNVVPIDNIIRVVIRFVTIGTWDLHRIGFDLGETRSSWRFAQFFGRDRGHGNRFSGQSDRDGCGLKRSDGN